MPSFAPVVTRFAPSPTGYLHIGGARTALFNWLYAHHTGGKMLLRIEDTDRERSTPQAIQAITTGLEWLGLHWDDRVVSQYTRLQRHQEIAQQLLDKGQAYHCYATPEELQEMRETARRNGQSPRYDGRWRDRLADETVKDIRPVVRLKAPQKGYTIVHDQVQGDVKFSNTDLDDFVLLRSDGTPTYMLAVVVDDHDMGVTHIIRGDDHLTNAARQTLIYQAMGWNVPTMAHIPLIHGEDGAKLSKRHGALGIEAYKHMGYLPITIRNYLARLGWSHGNDEIMSDQQMIAWFDICDVNKGAARFDFKKLEALNAHYIKQSTDQALYDASLDILPFISDLHFKIDDVTAEKKQKFLTAIPFLKERAKTVVELLNAAAFLFRDRPLSLDEKAQNTLTPTAKTILKNLLTTLQMIQIWSHEQIESTLRQFLQDENLKFADMAQPLRATLTGSTNSIGVFDLIFILGQKETEKRILDQIGKT